MTRDSQGELAPWRAWLVLAAFFGYGYVVSLGWHPYPGSYVIKAIPAIILAGLALRMLQGAERIVMFIAYLGSAAGDIFLDLDRTAYLPHGLGCFLVTQIGFAWVFARRATWMPSRLPPILVLVIAAAAMATAAWPSLGAMRVPVLVYIVALLTMASTALMVGSTRWIGIGAVVFLVSDTLIGINRFIVPFESSTAIIVAVYISAQLMIAYGLFGTAAAHTRRVATLPAPGELATASSERVRR